MINYKAVKINLIDYNDAFTLQKILQQKVLNDNNEQYILYLQHTSVITTGKRGFQDNLKFEESYYKENNISLVQTDRGGLATYHGPGQLVVYFIINLNDLNLGIKAFVNKIEDVIITILQKLNITAYKNDEYRGVFVENNKICAIGMQVTHNITTHGIALNVNTDLSYFDLITPCGITDKGVVSVQKILNKNIEINDIINMFNIELTNILGMYVE